MHVEQIDRIEDLAPFRSLWTTLLARTPGATFFQTVQWLEVYWKYYGQNQQLRVLLVYQKSKLAGIVPLVVRTEPTRIGALRFLTYPLDFWGSYYGPVGADPGAILDAGLGAVHAAPRDWDVLELRWLGRDELDCDTTRAIMKRRGFPAIQTVQDHTVWIRLTGTWESYLASRTSKWRNNYRRWLRHLEQHGKVEYLRYRPKGAAQGDGEARWDLFDACQDVARKSWQSQSPNGTTICHDSIRGFLRDVHAAAAALGALDLNLLLLDDTPIAFAYNYYYNGATYGLRIGFNPAYSRDGPGNVLYGKIIEDSFRRNDRLYDLGPGSLNCKKYFQTHVRPVCRCSHFPLTRIRPQLMRVKRYFDARAGERSKVKDER